MRFFLAFLLLQASIVSASKLLQWISYLTVTPIWHLTVTPTSWAVPYQAWHSPSWVYDKYYGVDRKDECNAKPEFNQDGCNLKEQDITFGGKNLERYAWNKVGRNSWPAIIPCKFNAGSRTVYLTANGYEGMSYDNQFSVFLGSGVQCTQDWINNWDANKLRSLVQMCQTTPDNHNCSSVIANIGELDDDYNKCICAILFCESEATWFHSCSAKVAVNFVDPSRDISTGRQPSLWWPTEVLKRLGMLLTRVEGLVRDNVIFYYFSIISAWSMICFAMALTFYLFHYKPALDLAQEDQIARQACLQDSSITTSTSSSEVSSPLESYWTEQAYPAQSEIRDWFQQARMDSNSRSRTYQDADLSRSI